MTSSLSLVRADRRGAVLSAVPGKAVAVALVTVMLFMSGCQPSTLISALDAVVSAAEIALPVIGGTVGIPPGTLAAIVSYLQAVDMAIQQASTILAGPGTTAEKNAEILAAFAAIARGCNCVPPGTPQVVVSVISAVASAIGKFLANFAHPPIAVSEARSFALSRTDRAALAKIKARAVQHAGKLKDLKK